MSLTGAHFQQESTKGCRRQKNAQCPPLGRGQTLFRYGNSAIGPYSSSRGRYSQLRFVMLFHNPSLLRGFAVPSYSLKTEELEKTFTNSSEKIYGQRVLIHLLAPMFKKRASTFGIARGAGRTPLHVPAPSHAGRPKRAPLGFMVPMRSVTTRPGALTRYYS